jgi:hypothetical protein
MAAAAVPERPTWKTEVERLRPQLVLVQSQMRANLWKYPRTTPATTVFTPQFKMMYWGLHNIVEESMAQIRHERQKARNTAQMNSANELAARIPLVFGEIYKAMTEVLPGPPEYEDMFVMLFAVGEAFNVDVINDTDRDLIVASLNGWRLDKSADGSTRWVHEGGDGPSTPPITTSPGTPPVTTTTPPHTAPLHDDY